MMINYTGVDKRIKALFDNLYAQYRYDATEYVGKWIFDNDLYRAVLVATISNSPSVDEVIYDLSWLGYNFLDIVSATLVNSVGKIYPIAHELYVDGNDLVYNGNHGTGTAYITVQFT